MFYKQDGQPNGVSITFASIAVLVLIIVAWMWFYPIYNVWQKGKAGEAQLREADQNRQIKIVEAEAQNIAAISNAEAKVKMAKAEAQAEIERAGGVAKANSIIAGGLKGNAEYLQYLWITHLEEGSNREVIYVPTEGQIPLMEAGKR
jgi:regulator of protease activity HflC (stomatin/prohibitin superfamily)